MWKCELNPTFTFEELRFSGDNVRETRDTLEAFVGGTDQVVYLTILYVYWHGTKAAHRIYKIRSLRLVLLHCLSQLFDGIYHTRTRFAVHHCNHRILLPLLQQLLHLHITRRFTSKVNIRDILFLFNNLDWGPVPRFAPWKHCSQCGLLYDSPFSKRSYFGRRVSLASTTRGRPPLAVRGGTMGEKWWPNGAWDMHPHAANLRHGTDNFTSLPK